MTIHTPREYKVAYETKREYLHGNEYLPYYLATKVRNVVRSMRTDLDVSLVAMSYRDTEASYLVKIEKVDGSLMSKKCRDYLEAVVSAIVSTARSY